MAVTETPIFIWPPYTYDEETGEYIYPFLRKTLRVQQVREEITPPRKPAEQMCTGQELRTKPHPALEPTPWKLTHREREALNFVVGVCIDFIEPNAGNIYHLVTKDLAVEIAEEERALLPKIDYVHPYWKLDQACVEMLWGKIKCAQKQWAHELARTGKMDVAVNWVCYTAHGEAPLMMPEDEATLLEKVWNDHYKQEDWDKEHYIPPKKINSTNPHHALVRREHATFIPPRPNKSAQCGFRTVVKLEDYYALLCMADHLPITVKPVIESGLVEPEELDEMLAYRVYRNIAKVERERKKEVAKQAARTAEQEREKQACTVAGERLNNHPITVLERRSRLWHVHPSTTWNCGGTGRDTTYFVSGHGDVKSVQDVEGIIESEESSVKSLEEMMGCKPT